MFKRAVLMDIFDEMLGDWQNFYFMLGGASATLIGLMFVALSLGMHLVNDENREDINTFVAPSIFYFVSAFLIACAMLVPKYNPLILAFLLFDGSVVGLGRTMSYVRPLLEAAREHQDFDQAEWVAQAIGPLAAYAILLAAAIGFVVQQWTAAFIGVAAAPVILMLCAIADTWSLVLWVIEQRHD
jgi:hypothetical protein